MDLIPLMKNQAGVCAFCTCAGFNVCNYAGADLAEAAANLEVLRQKVGADEVFMPRQTHSARVALAGEDLDGVDALVTNRPGQLLCINTADCLPLLLYDPIARVIGAAHCGWRGTVAEIARLTLERMESLGAHRENVVAAIGPHICSECFEVGPEVAAQFPREAVVERAGQKPCVSLIEAVRLQLPGVRIVDAAGCSLTDNRFYSVRRQGRELPFRTLSAIKLLERGYCTISG